MLQDCFHLNVDHNSQIFSYLSLLNFLSSLLSHQMLLFSFSIFLISFSLLNSSLSLLSPHYSFTYFIRHSSSTFLFIIYFVLIPINLLKSITFISIFYSSKSIFSKLFNFILLFYILNSNNWY